VPIGVELSEDLVGRCTPGSVATVVGLVKVQNGDAAAGGGERARRRLPTLSARLWAQAQVVI
jgi:hypothetical protein